MIAYRINIEVGYRNVTLEFESAEEAGAFASDFLLHVKHVEDDKKLELHMDIVNTDTEGIGENVKYE